MIRSNLCDYNGAYIRIDAQDNDIVILSYNLI